MLAKEILSKARDEVNQMCMEDLSNEIKAKQAKIDEFTRVNGKTTIKVDYKLQEKEPVQSEHQLEETKQIEQVE